MSPSDPPETGTNFTGRDPTGAAQQDGTGQSPEPNGATDTGLRALLDTAIARQNDVVLITEGPEHRIVYVNPAVTRHSGYTPDEVIGNTPRMFQGPDTSSETRAQIRAAVDARQPIRTTILNYRKDGTTYWTELDITPISDTDVHANHMVSVQRDVTERQTARDEMRRKDNRFLLALEASAHAVWEWNIQTDQFEFRDGMSGTSWNGQHHGIIHGKGLETLMDLVHPEDRDRLRKTLTSKLVGHEHLHVKEYRLKRPDGSYANVSDRQFILRDPEGNVVHLIGSILDISEKRELEARRQQSQRLELLGEMTGGIAHNFNNLLTVILGGIDRLRDNRMDSDAVAAAIDMIDEAAQRSAALTAHLTSFSQVRKLTLKTVDVGILFASIIPVWRNLLPLDTSLTVQLPEDLWPVKTDPAHLEAAILNLVLNSRDAMPDGGEMTITAENIEAGSPLIRARDGQEPVRYVRITVKDTGIGMPPEDVQVAFDPFFTTKPIGKGTGLGLSSAYGFMQQSGGFIRLASTVGKGTTVSVFIQADTELPVSNVDVASQHLVRDGGHRILMVDDDPLVREYVRALLTSLRYDVTTASNGADALEVLASDVEIDLLFTDILMEGGMNGWELGRQAQALRPDLPILFTSAFPDDVKPLKFMAGERTLLRKPYRARDLSVAVLAAIADKESRQRDT